MRAVQVTELVGPAGLRLVDTADPEPQGVLIDVEAAGVSFVDLLLSRGRYQDRPEVPFVPGVDVAGTVRSVPHGCGLRPGERVAAYVRRGGWAEVVTAAPEHVFALPDGVPAADGAALVLNYLTAHLALARRARLRAGETVLVLGAAGGLGTAAVQIANGLGARPIAVTSNGTRAAIARDAGATDVVFGPAWPDEVRTLAGTVDVVVDPVGGSMFDDALRLLAREGRYVVLGFASGTIPRLAVNRLLLRNVDVVGVSWGATLRAEPGYAAEQWAEVIRLHAAGWLVPVLGATYDLAGAADALRALESRSATGKITLRTR